MQISHSMSQGATHLASAMVRRKQAPLEACMVQAAAGRDSHRILPSR